MWVCVGRERKSEEWGESKVEGEVRREGCCWSESEVRSEKRMGKVHEREIKRIIKKRRTHEDQREKSVERQKQKVSNTVQSAPK